MGYLPRLDVSGLAYLSIILLVLALLLGVALSIGALAMPDGEEEEEAGEEYGEEGEREGGEVAESAGSLAFTLGLLANMGFVGYKWAKLHAKIKGSYRHVLNTHILLNILLGGLAIYHGYSLREAAGPVEYASVAAIIIILLSGLLLRYAKNRHLKWFARHIHVQRALALLLLILVVIHVATIGD